MISKLGQVMVYVADQDKALEFWTAKAGFALIHKGESKESGMRWFEVAPFPDSETTIVLHDKAVISKTSPELDIGTPSLLFFTEDIESLHAEFKERGVTTGELVDMGVGRSFNFADDEGNYFAVMTPAEA